MTLFDWVVLCVLVSSIVISALRGLVREILSVLGWIAAFVLASLFAADLANLLPRAIPGDALRLIVAYLVIVIGTLILSALLAAAIVALIRASGLVLADRGLGGLFGLARGVVIVLIGVILAGLTAIPQQPFWRDSVSAPIAVAMVRAIKPMLPASWAEHVHF